MSGNIGYLRGVFGDRDICLARELTKTFETIHGDNLEQLKIWLNLDRNQQKGEFHENDHFVSSSSDDGWLNGDGTGCITKNC